METCPHAHTRQIGDDRPFVGPVSTRDENRAAHGNITITLECIACGARRDVNINQCHTERGPWGPSRAEREARRIEVSHEAVAVQQHVHPPVTVHCGDRHVTVSIDSDGYLRITGPHTIDDQDAIIASLQDAMIEDARRLRTAMLWPTLKLSRART